MVLRVALSYVNTVLAISIHANTMGRHWLVLQRPKPPFARVPGPCREKTLGRRQNGRR